MIMEIDFGGGNRWDMLDEVKFIKIVLFWDHQDRNVLRE